MARKTPLVPIWYSRSETSRGWFYVALARWQPFAFLNHSGWVYADALRPVCTLKWWWRFAVAIPRQRGWRWD